jgi:hypothetical protein
MTGETEMQGNIEAFGLGQHECKCEAAVQVCRTDSQSPIPPQKAQCK